ncbi:hypothetical protein KKC1_12110, partial [Calderihabitans maritimus]
FLLPFLSLELFIPIFWPLTFYRESSELKRQWPKYRPLGLGPCRGVLSHCRFKLSYPFLFHPT